VACRFAGCFGGRLLRRGGRPGFGLVGDERLASVIDLWAGLGLVTLFGDARDGRRGGSSASGSDAARGGGVRRRLLACSLDALEGVGHQRVHLGRVGKRRDKTETGGGGTFLRSRVARRSRVIGVRTSGRLRPCGRSLLRLDRGLARLPLLDFAHALAQLLAPLRDVARAGELDQGRDASRLPHVGRLGREFLRDVRGHFFGCVCHIVRKKTSREGARRRGRPFAACAGRRTRRGRRHARRATHYISSKQTPQKINS
jgi:hypothetical protein